MVDINLVNNWLKDEVYRNSEVLYNEYYHYFLLDVVASLQNLLNYAITGKPYNYAFHWTNKIGYNGIDDSLLDECIKEDENDEVQNKN